MATFKLEEINADPRGNVTGILEHCEIDLSPDEFETVLHDVSREALQVKDLAQRSEAPSPTTGWTGRRIVSCSPTSTTQRSTHSPRVWPCDWGTTHDRLAADGDAGHGAGVPAR